MSVLFVASRRDEFSRGFQPTVNVEIGFRRVATAENEHGVASNHYVVDYNDREPRSIHREANTDHCKGRAIYRVATSIDHEAQTNHCDVTSIPREPLTIHRVAHFNHSHHRQPTTDHRQLPKPPLDITKNKRNMTKPKHFHG